MNRYRTYGWMKLATGTLKEVLGLLIRDADLRDGGKAERAEGKVQIRIGKYWESRRN